MRVLTKVHLVKAMVFPVVIYRHESWTIRKAEHRRIDTLNCGVGEDSWASLGLQGDPTSPSSRRSVLNIHWKDYVEAEAPILWPPVTKNWLLRKDPDAGKDWKHGKGDDRGWDGWMASPTQWKWVWASSGSWWWTGKTGMLQSMGSQRVGQLNWTNKITCGHQQVFPIAQMVKNLPAMQESQVRSLGQEDPLEKGMVIHSSILAWRIP